VVGRVVTDRAGRRVGTITDLYVGPRSGTAAWIVVDLGNRTGLIPVDAVASLSDGLGVPFDAAVVQSAPAIATGAPLGAGAEAGLRRYYDLARPGGPPDGDRALRHTPEADAEGAVSLNALEARQLRAATAKLRRSSSMGTGPLEPATRPREIERATPEERPGGRRPPPAGAGTTWPLGFSPVSAEAEAAPGETAPDAAAAGDDASPRRTRRIRSREARGRKGRARRRALVLAGALAVAGAVAAGVVATRDEPRSQAPAQPAAQPAASRPVEGGDFESGIESGWRASPGTVLERVRPGKDGGWAVGARRLERPRGRSSAVQWPRNLAGVATTLPADAGGPGTTIRVLAWAAASEAGQTGRVRLVDRGSGQELASTSSALERPRGWQRLAVEATVPEGASAADYEVQVGVVDPDPNVVLAVDKVVVETGVASGA
jgi:hypothetical protein